MGDSHAKEELARRIDRLKRDPCSDEADARLHALLEMGELAGVSEDEVMDYAFESIVEMTGSEGGYFHFVDDSAQTIDLVSWSRSVLEVCDAQKTTHYPVADAGIWADSVRLRRPVVHNDFLSEPGRRGYPEGHFEVRRHLSVPVIDRGRVVAVVGVGNKATDYDEADVERVTCFMDSMWLILKTKRAEDQLGEAHVPAPAPCDDPDVLPDPGMA